MLLEIPFAGTTKWDYREFTVNIFLPSLFGQAFTSWQPEKCFQHKKESVVLQCMKLQLFDKLTEF
jgi:hypothetical protein